ncbi:MAG: carbohydrate ABC transporter permease [Firmicutes bacterium]|nr:carbohydrate ABC transporter permease [Bacillota bacterium]
MIEKHRQRAGRWVLSLEEFPTIRAQEFLFAVTLTTSESMRTLPVGLYSFIGERSTDWGPLMAGAVITTIPILLFFGLTQKHFTYGVAGAVKG